MEYFLLSDLGYDGLMAKRYPTLEEAEAAYKEALRRQIEWDREYPSHPSDKGLVIIRGEIIASDSVDKIF